MFPGAVETLRETHPNVLCCHHTNPDTTTLGCELELRYLQVNYFNIENSHFIVVC